MYEFPTNPPPKRTSKWATACLIVVILGAMSSGYYYKRSSDLFVMAQFLFNQNIQLRESLIGCRDTKILFNKGRFSAASAMRSFEGYDQKEHIN